MRLIPPALPGAAFLLGATGEVVILATQGATLARDAVPLWVQFIPMGLVLGIGSWAIVRLFANERETGRRFDELEDKQRVMQERIAEREEGRHQQNVARMDAMTAELARMSALLLGIQGYGGLMTEQKVNQERRHQLAQSITAILARLHYQEVWAARVSERLEVSYDPPPLPYQPRRRSGDEDE